MRQLDPSPEQVGPILSRGKDIVVAAGAGTGKTRTLVARFLSLLADGIPLRSIVAITFTKKAAREMRNRIREEVRKYLLSAETSRVPWSTIYEELDAARISTIHSLAGDILRQHPAEMGLDPAFKMLDEGESARMIGYAIEAGLSWAGGDDQAARLFPIFGAWKLRQILGVLLGKRLDVSDALARMPGDLWSQWEPYLIAPLRAFVEDPRVRAGLDQLARLKYDGTLARAQEAGDLLADDLRIVIEMWETITASQMRGDWIQISRSVGTLGSHLKQKGKGENWAPAKPRSIIKEIQTIFNEHLIQGEFDLAADRTLAEEVIPSLRALFLFAVKWYQDAKEQVNGLDFNDLEEIVLGLLKEHPEVLNYWQGEIKALLVDEYQDTNARQRKLVNLLSGEENHLFIVGDGKQSIYRFRGADVAVFRQEQRRISQEGELYQLDTSYRSHPGLLDMLNKLMAPVLGDRTDLPYLEPFSGLRTGREEPPILDLPAYVEVHLVAGSKAAGAGSLAAEAAAARLLEIICRNPPSGSDRPLHFGDVAVLCRAAGSFADFERAFERAGIPYLTVAGRGFYQRPEIRDVLNALRAFADPQNDLALAGLMRSPVGGFPDAFLLDLRSYQQSENLTSLLDAARQYAGQVESGSSEGLASFIDLVDELSALAGRATAAELISRFLDRTAYAAGLTLAGQQRSVVNLRKLVADAQASGLVNLTDFLNAIEEMRTVSIREGEAQIISEGAVQIMTVHQAKGLEFPIVILGDAAKRERLTRDILIDDRFGLILPFSTPRVEEDLQGNPLIVSGKSLAYDMALENERILEEAESSRLLYVAATRAEELLIISGAIGSPGQDHKLPRLTGWLGSLADPLGLSDWDQEIARGGWDCHRRQVEKDAQRIDLAIYESLVEIDFSSAAVLAAGKEEEMSLVPSLWSRLERKLRSPRPAVWERKPIYPASKAINTTRAPSRLVGQIVHRALERWIFPADGEVDFLNWVEVEFKTAGLYEPKAIKSGYRRVRQILERFTDSELFQRMQQAELTLHEVPFAYQDDTQSIKAGSMDALFKEAGQWVLVEFKTDEIKAGEEIDWAEVDYYQQVAGYLDAAERSLKQRPVPILCFLDYGGGVKLVTDRW